MNNMVKILLCIIINVVLVSSKCPAGTSNLNNTHELRYHIQDESLTIGYRALQGPVTGDIYQYGVSDTSSPFKSFLIRFSNSNTVEWGQYFSDFELSINSPCIDSNEEFIYGIQETVTGGASINVYSFHAQNGTISARKNIYGLWCQSYYRCWLRISTDNALYGVGESYFANDVRIFRYVPDVDTTIPYIQLGEKAHYFTIAWLYSSNVFFVNPSSANDCIIMLNINMTDQTYAWFRKVTCAQLGTCNFANNYISYAVHNSNDDRIYLSLCENTKLYLFILNAIDGVVSKVYIADDFVHAYTSYLLDSQTLFTSSISNVDSTFHIFVYHLSNASFAEYKFADSEINIYDIFSMISNNVYMFGDYGDSSSYAVETSIYTIHDIPGISVVSNLSFSEADVVNYQTSPVLAGSFLTNTESVSDQSSSVTAVTSKIVNITVNEYTDVTFLDTPTDPEYFSLIEGWNTTLPINITCSYSGATSLAHEIENYENNTVPSWVTLDDANYQLNLSVPEVTATTDYYFRIRTNEGGNSTNTYKVVNLTVLKCEASNCDLCQINDTTSCNTCSSGYTTNGSQCVELASEETMPENIKNSQTLTQATIGVTVGVIAASSIMNMSSPVGIWCIIKHFQMLLLLILTGAFLPTKIRQYLLGMNIVLLNVDFIDLFKIPFIYEFYTWMNFEQKDDELKDIGIENGSTFINNIFSLALLLIFVIMHIPVAMLYTCTKSTVGKCNKLWRVTYRIMTFTAYIRLMIENFQNILLSSISEAYIFDMSSDNSKVSLSIACIFIFISVLFYVFIIYQFRSTKLSGKRKHYAYSQELFAGLKDNYKARAYNMILVTRLIILCSFLICLQDQHFIISVVIFVIIQILYFVMILCIRPFTQTSNNIIEIINELLLTGLVSILLHYNDPNKWNLTIENAFVYSITVSSCLVCFIITISFITSIVSCCFKKKSTKIKVKRCITKETRINLARHRKERRKKDRYDVSFDHFRSNAPSRIGASSCVKSNLKINY